MRSDTATWGKGGLPEVLRVVLGVSWKDILAQIRAVVRKTQLTQLSMHLMCGVWALPLEHTSSNSNLFFKMLPFCVAK